MIFHIQNHNLFIFFPFKSHPVLPTALLVFSVSFVVEPYPSEEKAKRKIRVSGNKIYQGHAVA